MTEIILHLSAGQGPQECRWVVHQLVAAFKKEAARAGLEYALMDDSGAASDAAPSRLVKISGDGAEQFAQDRAGTILWVGTSPFRPRHKRRNWFVSVNPVGVTDPMADMHEDDIAYQTMRASGPGGQHVNKTDSAVRATHRPTGLTATSQDQRSQHANRKIARLKLSLLLRERHSEAEQAVQRSAWDRNHQLERGNAVRTYAGPDFKLRK